jgi:hypothetical protein
MEDRSERLRAFAAPARFPEEACRFESYRCASGSVHAEYLGTKYPLLTHFLIALVVIKQYATFL